MLFSFLLSPTSIISIEDVTIDDCMYAKERSFSANVIAVSAELQ